MADDDRGPAPLEVRRYQSLVRQLLEEHGPRSKEAVGRRLGITGAMVGYVERGQKRGGLDSIRKAIDALGLDAQFFYNPDIGEDPPYGEHVVRGRESHWRTFLKRYQRINSLTAKQRDEIKNFAANNLEIKSWLDYERLAEMVLRDKESEIFSRKA